MNPYAQFLGLLPKQTKLICKVLELPVDGIVTVQSIRGTNFKVKGAGSDIAVNDYVLVVDDTISSKVPDVQITISELLI